jgi:hypothetical protein
MKIALGATLIFLFCIMPANAITGLEMNKFCNEPRNTPGEVSCITYMSGLLDGMYLADKMSANGNRYCLPGDKNIDAEQGVLIVKKYLREHPEHLHQQAGALAALAIYLLPCC